MTGANGPRYGSRDPGPFPSALPAEPMTSHAHAGTARFGPFVLDLRSGELTGNATRLHLRDKPFEALALLLEHPGEVVTRDELRERLWPSDVFVDFENNLNAAVNRLREALGDSAHAPRYVETLPRRGYRLLVPVTFDSPAEVRRRPRLVVLPLDNLGEDDAHGYFAAGMTEELTTRLAAADPEGLAVLARTSASQCAAAGKGVGAIGHDLDVDYVVEGSVRRAADRIRISVSSSGERRDARLGRSYDAELRDALAVQGDLARAITHEIEVAVSPVPARRRVEPAAYDAYLRGQHHARRFDQPGAWEAAIGCYREAVDRDPQFARAWAALAHTRVMLAFWGAVPWRRLCPPPTSRRAGRSSSTRWRGKPITRSASWSRSTAGTWTGPSGACGDRSSSRRANRGLGGRSSCSSARCAAPTTTRSPRRTAPSSSTRSPPSSARRSAGCTTGAAVPSGRSPTARASSRNTPTRCRRSTSSASPRR